MQMFRGIDDRAVQDDDKAERQSENAALSDGQSSAEMQCTVTADESISLRNCGAKAEK